MYDLPGVALRFEKAATGTALALRRNTLPVPSRPTFRDKLAVKFVEFVNSPIGAVIVALKGRDETKPNPDYFIVGVPLHISPRQAVDYLNRTDRPVMMALDTQINPSLQPHIENMPAHAHPAHYKSNPQIALPPPVTAQPGVAHYENGRTVSAPHLRPIPGGAA